MNKSYDKNGNISNKNNDKNINNGKIFKQNINIY